MDVPIQTPIFEFDVLTYGTFKAKARDLEAQFKILALTDSQMRAREIDPDSVSGQTRMWFEYMATFSVTCEQTPIEFDIGSIHKLDPEDGLRFYVTYMARLKEKEKSFRQGVSQTVSGDDMGASADQAVQGTQDHAVGPTTA